MASIFERLAAERPTAGPIAKPKLPPAALLLDWMQRCWTEPTITTREICQFGPVATKNRASAHKAAKTLAGQGWLTPIKAPRRDSEKWRILLTPLEVEKSFARTAESTA